MTNTDDNSASRGFMHENSSALLQSQSYKRFLDAPSPKSQLQQNLQPSLTLDTRDISLVHYNN